MNRREFLSLLASYSYSLQAFGKGSQAQFWWQDLNTSQIYSEKKYSYLLEKPGSIMKLVSAAALLQENLISPNQTVECRQQTNILDKKYTCQFPHGKVNLQKAIAYSCNVYFASVLHKLNPNLLYKYSKELGLKTNKLINNTIQELGLGLSTEILVTPQNLLKLVQIIALEKGNFIKPTTFQFIQNSMRLSSIEGTTKKIDTNNSLHLAAKTGSIPQSTNFHSWVIGYFPFENPQYAFCIFSPNGSSHDSAVPLAKQKLFTRKWL